MRVNILPHLIITYKWYLLDAKIKNKECFYILLNQSYCKSGDIRFTK